MKITLALSFLGAASAFAPALFGVRSSMHLQAEQVASDTSKLIEAALEAAAEFGGTSPEARVAWEAVDDLNVRDEQRESYAGGVSQEDCSVEEEASKECIEYGERLDSLNKLLEENTPKLLQAKSIMEEMRDIKIKPSKSVPGVDSPALKAAMESAKAISEKSGADSAEAKVAWSEVEEIASGNYSNALGGMLNDECLIETIEACEAIEELQRVLNLKKSTSRYSG